MNWSEGSEKVISPLMMEYQRWPDIVLTWNGSYSANGNVFCSIDNSRYQYHHRIITAKLLIVATQLCNVIIVLFQFHGALVQFHRWLPTGEWWLLTG